MSPQGVEMQASDQRAPEPGRVWGQRAPNRKVTDLMNHVMDRFGSHVGITYSVMYTTTTAARIVPGSQLPRTHRLPLTEP